MYEISVHAEFCAAHALTIAGTREPVHGHNWRVAVVVSGERLDSDGLVCDFHTVESTLRDVIGPMHNRNLNDVPPFDRVNPSAEHVAQHICDEVDARIGAALAPHARIDRVSVTEAPGCVATYRPTRKGTT